MKRVQSFIILVLVSLLCLYPFSFANAQVDPSVFYDILPSTSQVHIQSTNRLRTKTFHRVYSSELLAVEPSQQGNRISLGSLPSFYQPEQPIVPMDTFQIPLRSNETVSYIKTVSMKVQKMPLLNIPLEVAQKPVPIHELASPYNGEPFGYDTGSRVSSPERHVVTAQEIQTVFPKDNIQFIISGHSSDRYARITCFPVFLCKGDLYLVEKYTFEMGITSSVYTTSKESSKKAIILAPDEFQKEAQELQEIQEERGYSSKIVLLSSIQSYPPLEAPSYPSVSGFLEVSESIRSRVSSYDYKLAFKIRSYLKETLEDEGIGYLTILGDATCVPPSYYMLSPDRRNSYDQWVPTDIYYASPHGDGIEIPMEIAVGRLPVRDKKEAAAVVEKQKLYSMLLNKDSSWTSKATIMAGAPFGEHFLGELATARSVNLGYFSSLQVEKLYRTENKFHKDEFMRVLNEGKRGFLWAFGHGSGEGLALEPGYANAKDILSVPQKSSLPIVLSEACGNGAWDNRLASAPFKNNTDYAYPTSFSEAVVLSKGAGIAYVGGARVNYAGWSLSYQNGIAQLKAIHYMDAILEYFMKGFSEGEGALGDWALKAMTYYADEQLMWGMNGANVKTYFGFTLQGDPTIEYPDFDRKSDSSVPAIQPIESQPQDYRNWPLFSIDDGQEVRVQSNEERLRVVIADYTNMSTPFVEEAESIECSNGMHQQKFDDFDKKTYALRFITPDQKEQRIVFHGRYNHDVVIQPSAVQSVMRLGETRSQYAVIRNDGIYPVTECDIVCKEDTKEIHRKSFTSIPVLSEKLFYYTIDSSNVGHKAFLLETQNLQNESNEVDNTYQWDVQCTDQPLLRVGVLTDESGVNSDYVKSALDLSMLNAYFAEQNEAIEITQVPFQFYADGSLSFESLGYDVVVLYTNNFSPTNPLQSCQAALERFTEHGGVVLGMLCLGQSNNGVNLQSIQSFFGIDPEEYFQLYRTSVSDTEIVLKGEHETFSSAYQIQNRYTVLPKGRNWHQIRREDSTELIAIDDKGYAALLRNRNRWFYSGFLSQIDFKDQPESLHFFLDLLRAVRNDFPNVALQSVSANPLVPIVDEDVEIVATIVNTSQTTINFGTIHVGEAYVEFRQLLPREIRDVSLFIINKEVGQHTENVTIDCIQDEDKSDNAMQIVYLVDKKPVALTKPSLVVDDIYDFTSCMELYGTVQPPEATVVWNGKSISCNDDGSFVLVVDQKGLDRILLHPMMGDIEGDTVEVPLEWNEARSIEMHLHDKRAVANGTRITLQQPYQLVSGQSYFPLRDVVEALGGSISWNSATRMVSIHMEQSELQFVPGEEEIVVNGSVKTLTYLPQIMDGTTMVSIDLLMHLPELTATVYSPSQALRISSSLRMHHENPSIVLHPKQYQQENKNPPSFLGRTQYPVSMITCFDVYEEDLYISTPTGIYHIQEQSYECIFEYPSFLYQQMPSFLSYSHTVNSMFFRIHKDFIFLVLDTTIYIFDRSSSQLHTSIQKMSTEAFLEPIEHYSTIVDVEVVGNTLYVLDIYQGFLLFDIVTGDLLSTYYIPSYLYSFEVVEDTIYACSYWGYLVTLHLDGSHLQERELPVSYCYRLYMLDATTCLIGSLRNPTKLYVFDVSKELLLQKEEKDLQLGFDWIDQVSMFGNQILALGYSYQSQRTLALQSGLFSLDRDLSPASIYRYLESEAQEAEKDPQFISHVRSLHPIPNSPYLSIEQGFPYSDQKIRLLHTETGEMKTLSTGSSHPTVDSIYDTYWFQDTYSILFLNQETREYWFRQFQITQEGKKQTLVSEKLHIDFSLFPDQLAVNANGFCILDQYQSTLFWFDFEGKVLDRCRLQSGEVTIQIPLSFEQFDLDDADQAYILDPHSKGIFVYDTAGFLSFESLAFIGNTSHLSSVLYDEKERSLLDRQRSSLYTVSDQMTHSVFFPPADYTSIGCFSHYPDRWTVYDEKTGQLMVCPKDLPPSPPTPLSAEDITVFPDDLSFLVYPNKTSSVGHFSVSIPKSYSALTVHLPTGISSYQKRFNRGTDSLSGKQSSFSVQFSIEGLDSFKEETTLDIILEMDSVQKHIPIQIQTVYPAWEFMNGTPLFRIGKACVVGQLCSLVKDEQIWLSLQDLQTLFPMRYTIKEDTITIQTEVGVFVSPLDGRQATFTNNQGSLEAFPETFVQPVGDKHYLVRADLIFKTLGARMTYTDSTQETVLVEGWELVSSPKV